MKRIRVSFVLTVAASGAALLGGQPGCGGSTEDGVGSVGNGTGGAAGSAAGAGGSVLAAGGGTTNPPPCCLGLGGTCYGPATPSCKGGAGGQSGGGQGGIAGGSGGPGMGPTCPDPGAIQEGELCQGGGSEGLFGCEGPPLCGEKTLYMCSFVGSHRWQVMSGGCPPGSGGNAGAAGAGAAGAGAAGAGAAGAGGQACPANEPLEEGAPCENVSQACSYQGCREWWCSDVGWHLAKDVCDPDGCPPAKPTQGASCPKVDLLCSYGFCDAWVCTAQQGWVQQTNPC